MNWSDKYQARVKDGEPCDLPPPPRDRVKKVWGRAKEAIDDFILAPYAEAVACVVVALSTVPFIVVASWLSPSTPSYTAESDLLPVSSPYPTCRITPRVTRDTPRWTLVDDRYEPTQPAMARFTPGTDGTWHCEGSLCPAEARQDRLEHVEAIRRENPNANLTVKGDEGGWQVIRHPRIERPAGHLHPIGCTQFRNGFHCDRVVSDEELDEIEEAREKLTTREER